MNNVLLKAIVTKRYEVELVETEEHKYMIKRVTADTVNFSESFTDYHSASYVFDLTVEELEGN